MPIGGLSSARPLNSVKRWFNQRVNLKGKCALYMIQHFSIISLFFLLHLLYVLIHAVCAVCVKINNLLCVKVCFIFRRS